MPFNAPYAEAQATGAVELAAAISSNPKIKVYLNSTVAETAGAPGRFAVKIAQESGNVSEELCGAIVQASGFSTYDIAKLPELGGGQPNVVDQAGLEALAKAANGGPIALVQDGDEISFDLLAGAITGGDVTVVSDDAGLVDAAGDSLDAAGLFLTGGSLNWTTVDSGGIAAIPFRLDLDTTSSPSKFVLRNSAGLAISSWSEDGSLSLGTSSPSVSLGSTTVVPENPSAAATITLPATSGTVLLNSTVLPMIEQLCGTVEIDPGLINAKTSSETEAPYSGLSGAEVCSCVPLAEWGDDIIVNYCYAGSNALTVRLYNADTKSVNPPSRTMRFCCSKP